ncbi:RNB domain-containing ribonuclease [Georgenia sp. AZ-5]|uniref:RNB domain-containing ribonuclease n=1 Tax=Georgenia sp. AZ-5 TaxID=3367526 RepID=UPI003755116F
MPSLRLAAAAPEVGAALDELRDEVGIPRDFSPEALAEAEGARIADLPHEDATDVPFVTIDPPGSEDLDQAVHIARDGAGYVVSYAIASVASFVVPGGALDREVHARGMTVYGPAGSFPLHPPVLSAGAASLLQEQERPAYLWTLRLAADGRLTDADVVRARVRSRARLTYEQVQAAHDGGPDLPGTVPADLPVLLRTVGRLRQQQEVERGGVSLDIPEQEAVRVDHGYVLRHRATLPVEGWNAQVSLMTGIAAARMMREAGVGILRTLPPADPRDVARLRRTAVALGLGWPEDVSYGELLRTLDSAVPTHAAFLTEATTLLRGAGYLAFGVPDDASGPDRAAVRHAGAATSGTAAAAPASAEDAAPGLDGRVPAEMAHAAIAAEYAHVTAPLRRLVDRYGLEVCVAHRAGAAVPDWVIDALPGLPATMAAASRRAGAFERGAMDAIEALALEGHVGEHFGGVVVDVEDESDSAPRRGTVVLKDPAVRARVEGDRLALGESVTVRLAEVDVPARRVRFTLP